MRKTNKGFTLVELVVVIAIIGVLAAILVPSMLTYVRKARLKTANGNAKTAYNALAEYAADAQIKGTPAATAVGSGATSVTAATTSGAQGVIKEVLTENGGEAGYFAWGTAKIGGKSGAIWTQWARSSADDVFGQYPDPIQWSKVKNGCTITKAYVNGGV